MHLKTRHPFPDMISALDRSTLFRGVSDLPTWMRRVRDLAAAAAESGHFPDSDAFIGNAFEHLVECIVAYHRDDPDMNCASILPARANEFGIDFTGETHDGEAHTHQCKFRSDTNHILNNGDDNISNFPLASVGAEYAATHMTVWTTAKTIQKDIVRTARGLSGVRKFRFVGYAQLRGMLDSQREFWLLYAKNLTGATKASTVGEIDTTFRPYEHQSTAYENFRKAFSKAPESEDPGKPRLLGRFIYPTGGGKTDIQCLILNDRLRQGARGIHIVVAPRIVLVNQLMGHYRRMLGSGKHVALAFHSGDNEPDYTKVSWEEKNTTDPAEVPKSLAAARKMNKDLVVFSTYHSLRKLVRKGIVFDTMVADESQHCVTSEFFNAVWGTTANVKLFFTATERHGLGIKSNDNEEVFGSIIGQEAPSTLIRKGLLVKPVLHGVLGWRQTNLGSSFIDEAIHIARGQRVGTHEGMKCRTLFACCTTKNVKMVVANMDRLRRRMPDHDIFTIISNQKYGAMVNGEKVSRDEFMNRLRECDKNAMIFHYDILTEGIDIEGITGCAIMRKMGHARLVQTIGRCLRLYKDDNGEVVRDETGQMVKERALVSVPVINNDEKARERLRLTIRMLMEGGFEVNFDEIHCTDINTKRRSPPGGGDDGTDDDAQHELELLRSEIQTILRYVVHEIEEDIRRRHLKGLSTLPAKDLLKKYKRATLPESAYPKPDSTNDGGHGFNGIDPKAYEEGAALLRIITMKSAGHDIPMPDSLANELIEHAAAAMGGGWAGKKVAVLYNTEIVHALIWKHGVAPKNITYFGDCDMKRDAMKMNKCKVKETGERGAHLLDKDDLGEKFDVVVGNPPYQGQRRLHQKFFNCAVKMAVQGGQVAFIQPATVYFNKKKNTDKPSQEMRNNIEKYATSVKMIDPTVFDNALNFNDIAMTILTKNVATPPPHRSRGSSTSVASTTKTSISRTSPRRKWSRRCTPVSGTSTSSMSKGMEASWISKPTIPA